MSFQVRWTAAARDRLGDVVAFVARTAPVEAERLLDRTTERGESLGESPMRGAVFRGDPAARLRQVVEGPFRLVYRVDEEVRTVWIVALQHMAQAAQDVEQE